MRRFKSRTRPLGTGSFVSKPPVIRRIQGTKP